MELTLVPAVDNGLGEFQMEFEFTVRVAELDPGYLSQFRNPVLNISASADRSLQLDVINDFLDRCVEHQRSMGATGHTLKAVTS